MKNSISLFFVLFLQVVYSQKVGINTSTPQAVLHIQGTTQVDGAIHTGGDESTLGNPGKKGDLLVSKGNGKAPIWVAPGKIGIPEVALIGKRDYISGELPVAYHSIDYNHINYKNDTYLGQYDSTSHSFTVEKTGYYQIDAYIVIIEIPHGDGTQANQYGGTLTLLVRKNKNGQNTSVLSSSTGTPSGVTQNRDRRESVAGVVFLEEGEKISLRYAYTRKSKIKESGVSAVYLSE